MPDPLTREALAVEFDCLMDRAGVAVPADRRPGLIEAYGEFRAQLGLLRGPRTHVAEPSNVFRLQPKAAS
jgi:hypothetical protein